MFPYFKLDQLRKLFINHFVDEEYRLQADNNHSKIQNTQHERLERNHETQSRVAQQEFCCES